MWNCYVTMLFVYNCLENEYNADIYLRLKDFSDRSSRPIKFNLYNDNNIMIIIYNTFTTKLGIGP